MAAAARSALTARSAQEFLAHYKRAEIQHPYGFCRRRGGAVRVGLLAPGREPRPMLAPPPPSWLCSPTHFFSSTEHFLSLFHSLWYYATEKLKNICCLKSPIFRSGYAESPITFEMCQNSSVFPVKSKSVSSVNRAIWWLCSFWGKFNQEEGTLSRRLLTLWHPTFFSSRPVINYIKRFFSED